MLQLLALALLAVRVIASPTSPCCRCAMLCLPAAFGRWRVTVRDMRGQEQRYLTPERLPPNGGGLSRRGGATDELQPPPNHKSCLSALILAPHKCRKSPEFCRTGKCSRCLGSDFSFYYLLLQLYSWEYLSMYIYS